VDPRRVSEQHGRFRQDRRSRPYPTERLEILPNRINVDTGAYATGRLTCVVLESSEPRFLTTA
jgi:hypothetical protein